VAAYTVGMQHNPLADPADPDRHLLEHRRRNRLEARGAWWMSVGMPLVILAASRSVHPPWLPAWLPDLAVPAGLLALAVYLVLSVRAALCPACGGGLKVGSDACARCGREYRG
jgi:hypothetical protein